MMMERPEHESVVELAAALKDVRDLDADARTPFVAVFRALEHVEACIFRHKERFGVLSVLFQRGCEEFLLLSNTLAMRALQRPASQPRDTQENTTTTTELCGELLSRAEQHTRHSGYLRSLPDAQHTSRRHAFRLVTLNNLACHAQHSRKPLAAVGFLERALKLQLQSPSSSSEVALTRLNLCAVLSQLQRHAAAATHAKAAVAQLVQAEAETTRDEEVAQLLLVAHYNLAAELEHLSDCEAARRQYEALLAVAARRGLVHDLVDVTRVILEQEAGRATTRTSTSLAPRARTPRELQLLRRRPLSPRSLRQASA